MDYLKYSSDEMFSSTELIRKSKMIFEKVSSKKIDKAVILRDGKPSFIMLDFKLYEKLMKQYMKYEAKNLNLKDEEFMAETEKTEIAKSNTITPKPIENKDSTKLNKIDLDEIKELSEELSEQNLQDIIDDSISPIDSEIDIEELPHENEENTIQEELIQNNDLTSLEYEEMNETVNIDREKNDEEIIDENIIKNESEEIQEDFSVEESDSQDLESNEEYSDENTSQKDEELDEDIVKEIEEVDKEKESANIKKRKALEDFWG